MLHRWAIIVLFGMVVRSRAIAFDATAGARCCRSGDATCQTQVELETDFAGMLSGSTLEGASILPVAGDQRDSPPTNTLGASETLGQVWLVRRDQYRGSDVVPLPLPIGWAATHRDYCR